jgi:hypothetical protein
LKAVSMRHVSVMINTFFLRILIQFFMYVSFFRMLVKLTYKTTWVLYG